MLTALSPLDGRYQSKVQSLQPIFSEFGLIKHRLHVEIEWLITLCQNKQLKEAQKLDKSQIQQLRDLYQNCSEQQAEAIKAIEATTNHDVKAVEYFIQAQLKELKLDSLIPFVHFACTSEDINNLSYALMLKQGQSLIGEHLQTLLSNLQQLSEQTANMPMLSRTHGQAASPTTMGKEIKNVAYRLQRQLQQWQQQAILGKLNGAVGNFNAHVAAYPNVDWQKISQQFIEQLQLTPNPLTTQIEPHDFIAELMHNLMRTNTILIDLCRDIWSYISIAYFKQKTVANEVGSSTMPHKVNPIDFENAEGNLGLANAMADHLANKLPISRWQRDLTDSTVLRNLGTVFGYSLLAYQSCAKGLSKLEANADNMSDDLYQNWAVLGEAIQTVLRRYGHHDAYEQLKSLTRGNKITQTDLQNFIKNLELPEEAKQRLLDLTPTQYLGLVMELAQSSF